MLPVPRRRYAWKIRTLTALESITSLAEVPETGFRRTASYILRSMQNPVQRFRLRAPASGREAIADAVADGVYVDRETGEEMEVISELLPLAPSESALLRTPENLRACERCDQLIGLDVSDCPYCGLRQEPT